MIILGLNLFHADSSACLIKDGKIIYSLEEERFKRIKHYSGFPEDAIHRILKNSKISVSDIDYVTTNKSGFYNLCKNVSIPDPSFPIFKASFNFVSEVEPLK